jgi:Fur family ferric uptake transcriptional regulator
VYKTKKIRMTRQRTVILDVLKETATHPTADEIYTRVRTAIPRISLGTVYRNLEFLCEQGLIQKLDPGSGQRRFEYSRELHYHVRCVRCGCVEDLDIEPDRRLEKSIQADCDFEIIGHRLEFIGICPECRGTRE